MNHRKYIILIGAIALAVYLSLDVSALGITKVVEGLAGYGTKFVKRIAYWILIWLWLLSDDTKILCDNFSRFILMNPDPTNPGIVNIMTSLVHIVQPLYLMAIISIGAYLVFMSGSPSGRAKAKGMIPRLIIGMAILGTCPFWIKRLLNLSHHFAELILAQVDVSILTDQMMNSMYNGWRFLFSFTFFDIESGYFILVPLILLLWGTYFVLVLRYLMVVLWISVFPLTIFLYSFGFTEDIGRNMMEQTLLWTFLQAFYAILVVAIVCVLQTLNHLIVSTAPTPVFNPMFSALAALVPVFGPLISLGITASAIKQAVPSTIAFMIPAACCFALIIVPLLIVRIFRNFLP